MVHIIASQAPSAGWEPQVERTQISSSFEDPIGHSVQLNNDACFFLVFGKNELAISKCKQALRILKHELASMGSSDDVDLSQQQLWGEEHDVQITELDAMDDRSELCIAASPSVTMMASEGQPFVYTNAFRLETYGETSRLDIDLICAVIVFNMALSYHTCKQLDESADLRSSSLQLYELCLSLVENARRDSLECRIFRSVCLNNMAHLSYENDDFSDMVDLLDDLMQSLNQDESLCAFFEEGVIQGFVLNSMYMHPPIAARAA